MFPSSKPKNKSPSFLKRDILKKIPHDTKVKTAYELSNAVRVETP